MAWVGEGTWVDDATTYSGGEGSLYAPVNQNWSGEGGTLAQNGQARNARQNRLFSGTWAQALGMGSNFADLGAVSNFAPYRSALRDYAQNDENYLRAAGIISPSDSLTNPAVLDKVGQHLFATDRNEWNALRGFVDSGQYQPIREKFQNFDKGSSSLIGDAFSGALDIAKETAPVWMSALGGYFAGPSIGEGISSLTGAGATGGGSGMAVGGGFGGGGSLMPAAIPESASTLGQWGLTEISPGVFANAGNYAAFGGLGQGGTAVGGGPGGGGAASAGTGIGGIMEKAISNPQILGALGGAALGAFGGGGEQGTVTTEEGLPDWLKPYMKPQLDKYASEMQNYQVDPYGIMPTASQEFKNTLSGMYLDPSTNKYLEQYFNAGAERVKSNLAPSFGHMQAFGSHSGYNEALSRGLGDLSLGLYGGAYEKERDRMTAAMGAAPSFLTQNTQAAFSPYSQYFSTLGSLGKQREQPFFQPNPLQGILGGAMAGYGLGKIFT